MLGRLLCLFGLHPPLTRHSWRWCGAGWHGVGLCPRCRRLVWTGESF
jgi:hypothetical protein